jgi:hypothetical protein
MGIHADSTIPSCPAALIWLPGSQQIDNVSFRFTASISGPSADTPMRLTASHGLAQSRILDNCYSSETLMITWFHHREHSHNAKPLPYALLVFLLKPSVDVLGQYSLPNMDVRIATYLIIALLPKHSDISNFHSQLPRVRCQRLGSASWSLCRCELQQNGRDQIYFFSLLLF